MTVIHPTAIIPAGAEIGADCDIGPYCVIGAGVRLGQGVHLHEHVVVDGNTTLGDGCEIYPFACIGKQTQDLKFKGGRTYVDIGPRTSMREYVTVHASTADQGRTVIGADCHILAYCHIAHDCRLGDGIIMSNSTQLAGHVEVEDRAVLGGMCAVVQFVRIGRMAMIGAYSKLVQDIPPFMLADGAPAAPVTINKVGLERNRIPAETIQALGKVYRLFFRSNLTTEAALEQIQGALGNIAEVRHFMDFIRTSQRGIARPAAGTAERKP